MEIPEIARQLHVANVLEGSVRRSGDTIEHWAASNALVNSTRKASPIVLISMPWKRGKICRRISRCSFNNSNASLLSRCESAL